MSEKQFVVEELEILNDENDFKGEYWWAVTNTERVEDCFECRNKEVALKLCDFLNKSSDDFKWQIRQCEKWSAIVKRLQRENRELRQELNEKDKEIDLLRLELDTHKHPLWSTREAERKVSKLADSLADEIKKNGVLNEELNQLRIENMRLKKAEKINMEYAEQIVEENQKLRIAKNDLRIEDEQLKQKLEILGLNEKNDAVKMIDGKVFIRM